MIRANSLIIKSTTRNVIMLKNMTENENKRFINRYFDVFSEIVVADHDVCDHDLRKEIMIIVKFCLNFIRK